MKLNKKGFTLIELLITIALMLSLTILVIVGFTKVSDEKKNEADLLTEKQIITAAEQYFSSNYFYVDYMKKDSKAKVFVNLAKLVQEDYLNVTTKTSTEQKYNTCDIVYASYSGSGVNLNYLKFDDVFDESNKEKLGYSDDIGISYTEYLKRIGLEKTIEKQTCTAEVFTASDIGVRIDIDTDYLASINKTLTSVTVGDTIWYNNDVPLIVTVFNQDNKENYKNEIKSVDITLNAQNVDKTELSGSTMYTKRYRVILDRNNINSIIVNATTAGNKSAYSSETYYIDKEAPSIQMVAYKTDDKKITNSMPSLTSIPNADKINSDTWVNASGKKNVYLYIQVNDQYSGINSNRFSCKRVTDDAADANNDSISTDGKTYKKMYFYNNDKIVTYQCTGFDNAGNSSEPQTFTVKRDVTLPTVPIIGYKGEEDVIEKINTLDDLNKQKNNLTSYSSNTWTNKSIVLKPSPGDNLSLVNFVNCTDSRKSGNDHGDFNDFRRVKDNHEGTVIFYCSASDNAGNSNSSSFTVNRDITAPEISGFKITSLKLSDIEKTTSNYKSYKVRLEWDSKDEYSYIGKVKSNVANNKGTKEWDVSNINSKEYAFKSLKSYFKASNSFNGYTKTFKVQACDILGNCSNWEEKKYTVTDFACDVIKSTTGCKSTANNLIEGRVHVKCNAPVQGNVKVTYTYGDEDNNASGCTVKATNDNHNLSGEQNLVVYNFRGCGGYYSLNYLKVEVKGEQIYESFDVWDTDANSKDSKATCNPKNGKHTSY